MRNRIFLKAMAAFVAVIAAATLTLDVSIRHAWENAMRNNIERLLVQNAQGFALRVQNDHQHSLQQMAKEEAGITETRVTIIARDGVVLADSEADPRTMENHAGRPEVVAALGGRTGSSTRPSQPHGYDNFQKRANDRSGIRGPNWSGPSASAPEHSPGISPSAICFCRRITRCSATAC